MVGGRRRKEEKRKSSIAEQKETGRVPRGLSPPIADLPIMCSRQPNSQPISRSCSCSWPDSPNEGKGSSKGAINSFSLLQISESALTILPLESVDAFFKQQNPVATMAQISPSSADGASSGPDEELYFIFRHNLFL